MKGEARLRHYLQGTDPGTPGSSTESVGGAQGYVSSENGALDDAGQRWTDAMATLDTIIQTIHEHTPKVDDFGDTATGRAAHRAFVQAHKSLVERRADFQKITEALQLAGGGISYGHQQLNALPVAAPPGPKPPTPVHTNDWDPVMNMALARWYGNKAKYDSNPDLRDQQADAAADQMDAQFGAAIGKIGEIKAPKAPGSTTGGGDGGGGSTTGGGGTGRGGGTGGGGTTPTYATTFTAHHTTTYAGYGPGHASSTPNWSDPSATTPASTSSPSYGGHAGDSTTGGGDGVLDSGGTSTTVPTASSPISTSSAASPIGSALGGASLGRVGGSAAVGGLGLGALGLGAGMRVGGLGGVGGVGGLGEVGEPSLSTSAVGRGLSNANALGASSRGGGSAVTGRTNAVSTGAGGRGSGKNKKKGGPFSSYDDGSDWIDDDEAGPGILR